MGTAASEAKISCRGVWKVFGPQADKVKASVDADSTPAQVLQDTGHVLAVRDVSFDVRQGETFVVMGLSGSGKSTLVRCISRLVEPTAGSIIVNGEDIVAMDDKQLIELRRHNMSMVFQHFGLFPHRRVIDNIAYGLEVQGIAKAQRLAKAGEVLEMVGLEGWADHYPHQLSGGMQQRVGLGRALAVDPEILLFDEPFSALDPLIRRDMQDELLRIQEVVHKTMIFITHDFLEAIKMGDHIAIMKDGEFVQVGTPEEVVAHPANDYVRDFTEDVPRYKVLTARSVMTTAAGASANGLKRVPADTLLDQLIPLTAASDDPLAVVDADDQLLGTVDRTAVMMALGGKI
jgi:glycine betaine/proline transport system ATP-binding protein